MFGLVKVKFRLACIYMLSQKCSPTLYEVGSDPSNHFTTASLLFCANWFKKVLLID